MKRRSFLTGLLSAGTLASHSSTPEAEPKPRLQATRGADGHASAAESFEDKWVVTPGGSLLESTGIVPNSHALVKSLGDAAEYLQRWTPPESRADWLKRRQQVESSFKRAIGLERMPERTPLKSHVVARHSLDDHVIENVLFESRPGFPVSANLYLPKAPSNGKRAAILCPIGHALAQGKSARRIQARCIKLAQMGFVVLTYDAIGQGERLIPGNTHHDGGYALLPLGETIAGWMVWDSMRAIDYLVSRPDVDPKRVGVTGNSGGGLNTFYTAALDRRIRAAVAAGFTCEYSVWLKYGSSHCTCTHLPGVFQAAELFEIGGLIAPRAFMMLQGERDVIFPISGAKLAGGKIRTIYEHLGVPERARFVEVPGQPHAYSRPYREQMYGWMAWHLLGQGQGEPIPEGNVQPLDESDPRLLCDPDGSILRRSLSVVERARRKALARIDKLPRKHSTAQRKSLQQWAGQLAEAPELSRGYLDPQSIQKTPVPGGVLEKIWFLSEEGEYIPCLSWMPEHRASPARTVIIVDDQGKESVATSDWIQPLLKAGIRILAVDLRGRGETLAWAWRGRNTNFRLVGNQILFGRPLAGTRAFDLKRAVDYLFLRKEPGAGHISVVGLGHDALPALIAAATDDRIKNVAVARCFSSFVSQMKAMEVPAGSNFSRLWNSPMRDGTIHSKDYNVDLGSVIPFALENADLPDIVSLIAPRRVLFCQSLDHQAPNSEILTQRFRRVVESQGKDWIRYDPVRQLDSNLLLAWLRGEDAA
jgi:hypothetical protein